MECGKEKKVIFKMIFFIYYLHITRKRQVDTNFRNSRLDNRAKEKFHHKILENCLDIAVKKDITQ